MIRNANQFTNDKNKIYFCSPKRSPFQAIAIILSCIVYDHHISNVGIFGVMIVFFAIFLRVYSQHRLKTIRKRAEAAKLRVTT